VRFTAEVTPLGSVSKSVDSWHSHATEAFSKHPTTHLLHHLAGLHVLFQELIDLLDRGAAPPGNSLSSASVNDLVVGSFPRGH